MKQSAKVMVWGETTGGGLTKLHMLPTGQTLTSAEYYINQILAKEVTPVTSRRQVTDGPIGNIWSIIDETTFKDPAHKTMKELKGRLYALHEKMRLLTR